MLEAEAMDSEEEAEDSLRKIKEHSVGEPHNSRGEASAIIASDALADTTKFSLQKDILTAKPFDLSVDNQLNSIPQKEKSFGKATNVCDTKGKVLEVFSHPEGRATEQFSDNLGISIVNRKPNTSDSNILSMKCNSLLFNVTDGLMATTSCEEENKLSPLRYSRKASEKVVSPEEQFSNFCTPHKGKTEVNLKGDAKSSFTEVKNADANKCINSHFHSPMTDLAIPHVEGQTHNLPQKRKLSVSKIGSKSMKSDNISRTSSLLNASTSINSAELDSLKYQQREPEDILTNSETNTSIFHMVEDNDSFPQMQKLSASNSNFSSPKLAQEDSRICPKQSLSTSTASGPSKSTNALQYEIDHGLSHSDDFGGTSLVQPKRNPHVPLPKSSSLLYKRKSVKHGHSSSVANISDNSSSKSNNKDVHLSVSSKPAFGKSVCTKYGVVSGIGTMCNLASSDAMVLSECPQNNVTGIAEIRSTGNDPNLFSSLRVGDDGNANEASIGVRVLEASLKSMKKSETADKSHNFDDASINYKPEIHNEASEQHERPGKNEEVMPSSSRDAKVKSLTNTKIPGNCKQSKDNEGSIHCNRKALASRNVGCMPKARRKNGCKDKSSGESLGSISLNKTSISSGNGIGKSGNEDSLKEIVGKEDSPLEEKTEVEQYDPPESYSKAIQGDKSLDPEKENKLKHSCNISIKDDKDYGHKVKKKCNSFLGATSSIRENISSLPKQSCPSVVLSEPMCFILSGNHAQRKEFQTIISQLKGRICKGSHNWSYKATHFIVPDYVRRTEKFFAAAAAGRWILRADYLTASREAGKFLDEEPFEWHKNGFTEDGSISLEAPRKWRALKQRTGRGAFYGMHIIIYGECIAPSLDTLKRVVKAGDGTILATSPPYTRFLTSGIDFAIVSPSISHLDMWVQEFLRHEIPCILADYLVEYVCKPGYSLDKHVLYKTHPWVKTSMENLQSRYSEEMVSDNGSNENSSDDLICSVCGSGERGEVMLICGDEAGTLGCGVGTHIDCCDPPLPTVPKDDWFCSRCSKNSGHKTPTKSTKAKPKKVKTNK